MTLHKRKTTGPRMSPLPRTHFLQIGDLHLPLTRKLRSTADLKDARFPKELEGSISTTPLKIVFRNIYQRLEDKLISGVFFMGDLTDIGNIEGYHFAARYVSNALQLGKGKIFEQIPVGIVCGNHDISRDLALDTDSNAKFLPLQEALAQVNLPAMAVSDPKWLHLGNSDAPITVGLLNSCIGCGAKEAIPPEFRESVAKAIADALVAGHAEKAIRAYYDRQFDTPAFDLNTVEAIRTNSTSKERLLILIAHHNLLPQSQPRISPYTELINSGSIRTALLDLHRPVLYLHGHTHEDRVEIISRPNSEKIAIISAPTVEHGFNEIEVVFTKSGIPLICHIVPWRFSSAGNFGPGNKINISLVGQRTRSTDSSTSVLYANILKKRYMYWPELISNTKKLYKTSHEDELEQALELLHSDGRISIDNYDLPRTSWVVGARI
jgi:hypothetical protein